DERVTLPSGEYPQRLKPRLILRLTARLEAAPFQSGAVGSSFSASCKSSCSENSESIPVVKVYLGKVYRSSTGQPRRLSLRGFCRRTLQRTTSTSLTLSRARKNLIEAKSRKRFSMWRLLKTR